MQAPTLGGEAWMAQLTPVYFPETISVFAVTIGASDAYGKPTKTLALRTGLIDVAAAADAVQYGKIIQREEERREDITRITHWYRLVIAGSHPEIVDSDEVLWRGEYWNVNSAVVDPSASFTTLLVELTDPSPS